MLEGQLLVMCLLLFVVNQTKGNSLATFKNATSSSIYYPSCYGPSNAIDGKYMQDDACGNMFLDNDISGGPNWWIVDLGVKYFIDRVKVFNTIGHETSLNMFIVGLATTTTSVVRNTYDICEQFSESTSLLSSYQVKCYANLAQFSVVIIQQPLTGAGWMAFGEVEVFACKNPDSKVWLRNSNKRLEKSPTLKLTTSSRITCVIQCNIHKYCSANFNAVTKICECFQNLKETGEPYVADVNVGWDYFKFQYV